MTRSARLILLTAFAIAAFLYILALTPYVGGAYDDGRYITLAQSLAKGAGFSDIQVPGNPPEPQYPPGWPLLLSAWWFIAPDFPPNAFGFKLISSLCALAFAAVNYGWMRWRGDATVSSMLVTLLTLFNPLVFGLATSAFSEMAYACFSVLALWLVERYSRSDSATWREAIVPSLVTAWTMYVRSVGVVVALAAVVFLFFRKDRRKAETVIHTSDSSFLAGMHYDPAGKHVLLYHPADQWLIPALMEDLRVPYVTDMTRAISDQSSFWLVVALDHIEDEQRAEKAIFDQNAILTEEREVGDIYIFHYTLRADPDGHKE